MALPNYVKDYLLGFAGPGYVEAAQAQRNPGFYEQIRENAAKRERLLAEIEHARQLASDVEDGCYNPQGTGPGCTVMGGKRKSKRKFKKRKSKRRR
jgi:hypothetical protein